MPLDPAPLRPLFDKVLLTRCDSAEKSPGGILLVAGKNKPTEAIVVAVGPGKRDGDGVLISPTVRPGDRVVFGTYSGTDVAIGGVEYLIMPEHEILAIVPPSGEPTAKKGR